MPPPNPRMQPTGRSVPGSARALIAEGDQWNRGLCGRRLEGPQLMRISLDRRHGELVRIKRDGGRITIWDQPAPFWALGLFLLTGHDGPQLMCMSLGGRRPPTTEGP